jgi:hypothetical protein
MLLNNVTKLKIFYPETKESGQLGTPLIIYRVLIVPENYKIDSFRYKEWLLYFNEKSITG